MENRRYILETESARVASAGEAAPAGPRVFLRTHMIEEGLL